MADVSLYLLKEYVINFVYLCAICIYFFVQEHLQSSGFMLLVPLVLLFVLANLLFHFSFSLSVKCKFSQAFGRSSPSTLMMKFRDNNCMYQCTLRLFPNYCVFPNYISVTVNSC